jgi:hypothetical protein
VVNTPPPVVVLTPPPIETPPPAQPPVITPYNAPPNLEQGISDTTYDVFFQADAPSGDASQITITTNNPGDGCAPAGPVFLEDAPDLYGSQISFGGSECVGDDVIVTAEIYDVNTGLSDTVVEDLGDIQPRPDGF